MSCGWHGQRDFQKELGLPKNPKPLDSLTANC